MQGIVSSIFSFLVITYLFWLIVGRKFGEDSTLNMNVLKPLVGILYSNGIDNWLGFDIPLWFVTCLRLPWSINVVPISIVFYGFGNFYHQYCNTQRRNVLIIIACICSAIPGFLLSQKSRE